jgi:hypothetical protein
MTTDATVYEEMIMPTPKSLSSWMGRVRLSISEEGFIDFVARLSPWIAPLPSAFFIHGATIEHLRTGNALAWIVAIVIETLGLTTIHTSLSMFTWNKGHLGQPEKQAPFGLAVCLALVYIIATLGLIGVLEVYPGLQNYAPAMFPVLAAVGAVNLAMRSTHNRRIREEKEEAQDLTSRQRQLEDEDRKNKLKEKRMKWAAKYGLPVSQPVNLTLTDRQIPVNDSQNMAMLTAGKMNKIDGRRQALLGIVAVEPTIELAELQRRLGLGSVNTVKEDIKALCAQKKLEFQNRTFTVKEKDEQHTS